MMANIVLELSAKIWFCLLMILSFHCVAAPCVCWSTETIVLFSFLFTFFLSWVCLCCWSVSVCQFQLLYQFLCTSWNQLVFVLLDHVCVGALVSCYWFCLFVCFSYHIVAVHCTISVAGPCVHWSPQPCQLLFVLVYNCVFTYLFVCLYVCVLYNPIGVCVAGPCVCRSPRSRQLGSMSSLVLSAIVSSLLLAPHNSQHEHALKIL